MNPFSASPVPCPTQSSLLTGDTRMLMPGASPCSTNSAAMSFPLLQQIGQTSFSQPMMTPLQPQFVSHTFPPQPGYPLFMPFMQQSGVQYSPTTVPGGYTIVPPQMVTPQYYSINLSFSGRAPEIPTAFPLFAAQPNSTSGLPWLPSNFQIDPSLNHQLQRSFSRVDDFISSAIETPQFKMSTNQTSGKDIQLQPLDSQQGLHSQPDKRIPEIAIPKSLDTANLTSTPKAFFRTNPEGSFGLHTTSEDKMITDDQLASNLLLSLSNSGQLSKAPTTSSSPHLQGNSTASLRREDEWPRRGRISPRSSLKQESTGLRASEHREQPSSTLAKVSSSASLGGNISSASSTSQLNATTTTIKTPKHQPEKPTATRGRYKKLKVQRNSRRLACCDDCSRRYVCNHNPERLIWHRLLPVAEVKSDRCDVCGGLLDSTLAEKERQSLIEAGTIPALSNRLFLCKFCNSTFSRGDRLLAHSRKHTGEKAFTCKICFSSFTRKNRLTDHMKLSHPDHTEPLKYACVRCQEQFTLDEFHQHMQTAHGQAEAISPRSKRSGPLVDERALDSSIFQPATHESSSEESDETE